MTAVCRYFECIRVNFGLAEVTSQTLIRFGTGGSVSFNTVINMKKKVHLPVLPVCFHFTVDPHLPPQSCRWESAGGE